MQVEPAVTASRSWERALAEHDAAVAACTAAARGVPAPHWPLPQAPGKWSPAEEVLHVVLSYEAALRGARTGVGMRPRVSPARARLLRWFVLPLMLNSSWFPRAKAPAETRPPAGTAPDAPGLTQGELCERLGRLAREAGDELRRAGDGMRFHHAYFGDLAPRTALRMLSAHTRHHARRLRGRYPTTW